MSPCGTAQGWAQCRCGGLHGRQAGTLQGTPAAAAGAAAAAALVPAARQPWRHCGSPDGTVGAALKQQGQQPTPFSCECRMQQQRRPTCLMMVSPALTTLGFMLRMMACQEKKKKIIAADEWLQAWAGQASRQRLRGQQRGGAGVHAAPAAAATPHLLGWDGQLLKQQAALDCLGCTARGRVGADMCEGWHERCQRRRHVAWPGLAGRPGKAAPAAAALLRHARRRAAQARPHPRPPPAQPQPHL